MRRATASSRATQNRGRGGEAVSQQSDEPRQRGGRQHTGQKMKLFAHVAWRLVGRLIGQARMLRFASARDLRPRA
jgi:hypothetical protein